MSDQITPGLNHFESFGVDQKMAIKDGNQRWQSKWEEYCRVAEAKPKFYRTVGRQLMTPLLAIATALLITVPIIGFTLNWDWAKVAVTYGGLLDGALFKQYAFANTLVSAIPLMFTGLALSLGFRTGVFNIGASGQFLMGATCAVWVGYALPLPPGIHLLAALTAGISGGAAWGAIPGFLKAQFGSHEVINTIMLNYLAFFLQDWLVKIR
ncbi:MAG: ABC transporter permease [Leptolyngbyaceae cyanobacterium CRU_2_3]|nr:ABC transporter permease [Leptolyngbyaceae cyanobacterium CRU_2_3]